MINSDKFSIRLKKVMDYYQLSSAAFADKIDVQRSSISHLLSGRNKPSLEFVLKVLEKFKEVELYWLLNGKGIFPSTENTQSLPNSKNDIRASSKKIVSDTKQIDRIIIFYSDGTFENYNP